LNHIYDDEHIPGLCVMVNKLLPASETTDTESLINREYCDDQLIEQPPQSNSYSKNPRPLGA